MTQFINLPNTVINEEARAEDLPTRMEKENFALPEFIIDNDAIQNEKDAILDVLSFINSELVPALIGEEITPDMAIIKGLSITKGYIAKLIDKRLKEYLSMMKYLPKQERSRVEDSFKAVKDRLANVCDKFYSYRQKYQFTIVKVGDQYLFDSAEVESYLKEKYTYHFTDAEREYLSVALEARQAIEKLKQYEISHGVSGLYRYEYVGGMALPVYYNNEWLKRFDDRFKAESIAKAQYV